MVSGLPFPFCVTGGEVCGLRGVDVSADARVIHKQKGLFEYSIEPSSRKMLKHIFLMVVDFQKFSEITFFLSFK